MKKTFTILSLFTALLSLAQVGINNSTPQQELHITGSTSTIRVEGLNTVNNPLNLGANENTRVFADADGDLVLSNVPTNIDILFNPANYLSDPLDTGGSDSNIINQTGVGAGYSPAGWPRQTGPGLSTFTLTRPAIVEINYAITYSIDKSNVPITDHHARTAQFFVFLRQGGPSGAIVSTDYDGAPINFAGNPGALGYSGNFYTNGDTTGASGLEAFNKKFYATGHDYVKLGPGTYCPMFQGILFVASTTGTGAVQMQLGGGDDEIIVIAHYYN
ncbi:nitric oxide synthase oxygenase [Flavobacterium enshiense]|uniref:nitric oxide synthase oxygenase n=1 Tax=Flavobacterium enshiense TaxID=1341165 RepID=UPI00345D5F04